jgi:two-component system, sensor histidine kinase and response regulator
MASAGEIRVLIIDDSPEDRETYRRLLLKTGPYAVDEAQDGAEGLARACQEGPDCVLLDYRLPDIDGLALVQKLVSECGQLPIVFLTGAANEDLAARALAGGAQDYLCKDRVDADSLERSVRYAIERNRASARIAELNQELREELGRRLEELRGVHAGAIRNERLAALGTLAAGVAHDLNNPLMGVITHVQFGMRRLAGADAETKDALEKALKYSKRCADIVNDLLSYSRASLREPDIEADLRGNVYRAIAEALSDTRTRRDAVDAELVLELEPKLPEMRVDTGGMRQVLVNLISNACDAVRGCDKRTLTIRALHDGAKIVVAVADTGQGMEDDARAHVFEPFFTTKTKTGTGLGLALCKNIVEGAGGEIAVASIPGNGTTFTLELPAVVGAAPR